MCGRRLIRHGFLVFARYQPVMGQSEGADDRRRRDSVFLLAQVTGADGSAQGYRARNLSADGVCIDQSGEFAPGMTLTLSIGLVEKIEAEVMWSRDGQAGLKFAAPIDPALARKRAPKSLDPKSGWGRVGF